MKELYTHKIETFLPVIPLNTEKKNFNAGIVEHSVSFDTHGNGAAGNQLKGFLNGITGE